MTRGGLPHSETAGSPHARCSPARFAACRVLPRPARAVRHPPSARFASAAHRHTTLHIGVTAESSMVTGRPRRQSPHPCRICCTSVSRPPSVLPVQQQAPSRAPPCTATAKYSAYTHHPQRLETLLLTRTLTSDRSALVKVRLPRALTRQAHEAAMEYIAAPAGCTA